VLLQAETPTSVAPASNRAARLMRARAAAGADVSQNVAGRAAWQNGQTPASVMTWRLQAGQGQR
jgi:hypothetical protein